MNLYADGHNEGHTVVIGKLHARIDAKGAADGIDSHIQYQWPRAERVDVTGDALVVVKGGRTNGRGDHYYNDQGGHAQQELHCGLQLERCYPAVYTRDWRSAMNARRYSRAIPAYTLDSTMFETQQER